MNFFFHRADELLLQELVNYLQKYLTENKFERMKVEFHELCGRKPQHTTLTPPKPNPTHTTPHHTAHANPTYTAPLAPIQHHHSRPTQSNTTAAQPNPTQPSPNPPNP